MPPLAMHVCRHQPRLAGLLAALLAIAALGTVVLLAPAHGAPSQDQLKQQIDRQGDQEQQLSSAAAKLGQLEAAAQHAVDVLQQRLDANQARLDAWQAKLAQTEDRFHAAQARLRRLQAKLARDRTVLARMLRGRYMTDRPDLVSVVLNASGFANLVEQMDFLHEVQRSNTHIVDNVKQGRADATAERRALAKIVPEQRAATEAAQHERDATAAIGDALEARRNALAEAHAARLAALQNTRASRHSAEKVLKRLQAEQEKAAVSQTGPGGPWAIPWAIVQCESGGQNLPPNSATASGYYQFIDPTWQAMGGSTPHAYQASKAEQDRLAARLWAGGSGARNWDCAFIVGIL